jgi:superfamily I DNA/RNA helicase
MNFHQSKGREFDAVVIFDASPATFDPRDQERVRLFYVAITRARKHWEVIAMRDRQTPLLGALGA